MTIEEAVAGAARCLKAGVAERILALTLMDEGFKPEKVKIIIRWAKAKNEG